MFNNKILRQRVRELELQVEELRNSLSYYEKPFVSMHPSAFRLTANDILNRFDELYDFLKVERITNPQQAFLKKKITDEQRFSK